MEPKTLPVPADEAERIRVIDQSGIMYSEEEEEFQELVQVIAEICGVKMALVTIVHSDVQWFKAKVGIDVAETPRELSFCQHAIMHQELMEINDTLEDNRFSDHPFVVDGPKIRFYAGHPIVVEGHSLGTLCVVDDQPKLLTDQQREALEHFGNRVAELISIRKAKMEAAGMV